MSCSARLPVYVFLTSMLFVGQPLYAAVAFAGCYLLGGVSALVSAAVLRRTLVKGTARPMVLELPSYKMPSFTNALISARDQGFAFLKTAGTIIMAISVVMWWLSPTRPRRPRPKRSRSARAAAHGHAAQYCSPMPIRAGAGAAAQSFAVPSAAWRARVLPAGYDWQSPSGAHEFLRANVRLDDAVLRAAPRSRLADPA